MRQLACTMLLLAALPACTLVTDFSDPGGDLYSLDENLSASVTVALSGETASLTLSFVEALPGTAEDDAALLALITDGTVDLVVTNDTTDVSFNLAADGTYAETPTAAGHYNLALGSDRKSLVVNFYNEVLGTSLHAGGDYSATIGVLDNDWFLVETFGRDVTVQ